MSSTNKNPLSIPMTGVVLIIALWKLGALYVGTEVLLPGPFRVAGSLLDVLGSPGFMSALGASSLRGFSAFFLSALLGLVCGVAAGLSPVFRNLVKPLVIVIKSTPVMSFILLALIWFPAGLVPVFVSVLMAFPIIYENVVAGIRNADPRLIEMARVYRVPRRRILGGILLPGIYTYFSAGARTALGIIWKAVIAAEILSRPEAAVGSAMYEAKIYIETAEVIAWTVVAVLLSALSEFLLGRSTRLFTGLRRGGGML
ncbi:ABC transporter permease subunit [Marispirochaeta aestuarii]|uniref:ABC transporter permease n=1 Tax=Marispirochaeta aestuarii TaxID=1963862 RepID=UPI0029C74822|nr:ABC transporter permease subunit [Marispirochaeta aestuarii]